MGGWGGYGVVVLRGGEAGVEEGEVGCWEGGEGMEGGGDEG